MKSNQKKKYPYKALKVNGRRIDEHRYIAIQNWGEEAVKGMDVHHKNGLKYDNRIENLELIPHGTHTRNHFLGKPQSKEFRLKKMKMARDYWNSHTHKYAKSIVQCTLDNIPIVCFESLNATESYGFNSTPVSRCCSGERKTYRNFKWRYRSNDEELNLPILKRVPKPFYKQKALEKIGGLSEKSIESDLKADGSDEPSKVSNPLPFSI